MDILTNEEIGNKLIYICFKCELWRETTKTDLKVCPECHNFLDFTFGRVIDIKKNSETVIKRYKKKILELKTGNDKRLKILENRITKHERILEFCNGFIKDK